MGPGENSKAEDNPFEEMENKKKSEVEEDFELDLVITNVQTCQQRLDSDTSKQEEKVNLSVNGKANVNLVSSAPITIEPIDPNDTNKRVHETNFRGTAIKRSFYKTQYNSEKQMKQECTEKAEKEQAIHKFKIRKDSQDTFKIVQTTLAVNKNCNENKISVDSLSCQLCEKVTSFKNRSHLYTHYTRFHYKQDIQSIIGETKTCPVCKMKCKATYDLITHVGSVHNYVDKFLPTVFQIPLQIPGSPLRKMEKSNKSSVVSIKTDYDQTEDNRLLCQLCDHLSYFKGRSDLYGHYSKVHYKMELLNILGNTQTCPVCNMNKKKRNELIIHVGRVHSYVDKFLPECFQVPPKNLEKIQFLPALK
eukprot:GFUD01033289.1.p1 GENE.GFUD01033289.1~~GFUD01033289.1.p1  ORF type:complete len:395 (+),score=88.59 GFUD01033289.1:100-1185(+)